MSMDQHESHVRQTLIDGLNRQDEDAVGRVFAIYSQRLARLAAGKIDRRLDRRFDGEDVVQSVFRTFLRRHELGKYEIDTDRQLWNLLVTITIFKTRSYARRHKADKRDVAVEQELPDHFSFLADDPQPKDAIALWEEVHLVLAGLPEKAGLILAARLEGNSKSDIAENLGISRQTVHRICSLLDERLRKRFESI